MSIVLRRPWGFLLLVTVVLLAELTVNPSPVVADPPPCADLVITGFTISPASTPPFELVVGKNAKIEITVLNQGSCRSLSFVTQWKSDRNVSTGPSTYVAGLDANQSRKITLEYAFPKAGSFTTVANVDSENTVDETNESNNLAIQDVTVLPDLPDLVITSFTILPAQPVQGIEAKVNIRVKNQGSHAAGPFVVQWKSDRLAPSGPSTQIASLAAGASVNVAFDYAFPAAGDYTSVATVDTDKSIAEWNEDNNIAILAVNVQPSKPDLVITGIRILPSDPAPGFPLLPVAGLNATIKITVRNQGNLAAGPFVVQWKSDLAAPTGPTGHVDLLAPGGTTVVTFEYAFPRAGNFTTAATVDSENTVVESNETNNLAIAHTVVQEAVIDLVLTGFKVEPAPGVPVSTPPLPVQGRLSRATMTVANRGNYPAGDFTVEWKPTLLSPGLSTQVNGLKYGLSTTVIFDYTYPTAGTAQTRATVDATSRVRETDETNNSQTKTVVVEPQRPDLTITLFRLIPASPVAGTKATAEIRVWNRGNTPAGPFVLQWKPSPLAPNLSSQINGLDVGQATTVSFDYTYAAPGTIATTTTVDPVDRVLELDETNNSRSRNIVVQRATRDLVISDFRIVQGSCDDEVAAAGVEPVVAQGSPIQACVTVQNLGNSPIGPFIVSWNPDAFGLIVPSPATKTHQVDSLGAGQETLVAFDFVYTQAGNFRSVAVVDAFGNVAETNESNNLEILNVVVEATGPDLVIDELVIEPGTGNPDGVPLQAQDTCYRDRGAAGVSPTRADLEEPRLTQGEPNRVCIKVRNQGDRPAGPFVVEWNPDALGLATPSPSTVSTQVEGLTPGGFILVEFSFIYDQAGTFRTIAKADAFNNVGELLEGNNEKIGNVVVDPVGPDLVISSFSISSGNVSCTQEVPRSVAGIEPKLRQGEVATVCIEVENRGDRPAGPFVVEWNPDANGLITPSPATLSTQVDGLGVFATQMIKFNFTYHQYGGFRTIAKADAFNNVTESNEANNLSILNVVVDPALINLRITGFTVTPNQPDRGSKITAHITVCETQNKYPTGAFSVQWKPTGKDAGFGPTARIQGLQPGECKTVTLESTIRVADKYQSWAMVDVNDEVIETDESEVDNTETVEVDVQPRKTTIVLKNMALHVVDNEGDCEVVDGDVVTCNGEWAYLFAVVDPSTDDSVRLTPVESDSEVDGGDNLGTGTTLQVTLVEAFPLVVVAGAAEVDVTSDPEFLGVALELWSSLDYLNVGSSTVSGQKGVCSNGRCFDFTYTVEITDKPDPPYAGAGVAEADPVEAVAAEEPVELPVVLSRLTPQDATLPDGLSRAVVQWDISLLTGAASHKTILLPFVQR